MRTLVVLVVCVCLFGWVSVSQTATQHAQSQSLQLKGIKDKITIRRDDRGIPYIEAQNDEDLYFGQGYAQAADRLSQMDFFRRTARGELAEIVGTLAVDQDKLHRTYGVSQAAEAEYASASPRSRALLEAYARGVNAYASSLYA